MGRVIGTTNSFSYCILKNDRLHLVYVHLLMRNENTGKAHYNSPNDGFFFGVRVFFVSRKYYSCIGSNLLHFSNLGKLVDPKPLFLGISLCQHLIQKKTHIPSEGENQCEYCGIDNEHKDISGKFQEKKIRISKKRRIALQFRLSSDIL